MFHKTARIVCVLALAAAAGAAERVECRSVADNWVEVPRWEPHSRKSLNHGSDQQLVID